MILQHDGWGPEQGQGEARHPKYCTDILYKFKWAGGIYEGFLIETIAHAAVLGGDHEMRPAQTPAAAALGAVLEFKQRKCKENTLETLWKRGLVTM